VLVSVMLVLGGLLVRLLFVFLCVLIWCICFFRCVFVRWGFFVVYFVM